MAKALLLVRRCGVSLVSLHRARGLRALFAWLRALNSANSHKRVPRTLRLHIFFFNALKLLSPAFLCNVCFFLLVRITISFTFLSRILGHFCTAIAVQVVREDCFCNGRVAGFAEGKLEKEVPAQISA